MKPIARVLHLADGTNISDNPQIEQTINKLTARIDPEKCKQALRHIELNLDVLKPTVARPFVGTLEFTEPGYTDSDGLPITSHVNRSADVELWMGEPISDEGERIPMRPPWREYWFTIEAEFPFAVAAQIPISFNRESWNFLPIIDMKLEDEKLPADQRTKNEAVRQELFALVQAEVLARLQTWVNS